MATHHGIVVPEGDGPVSDDGSPSRVISHSIQRNVPGALPPNVSHSNSSVLDISLELLSVFAVSRFLAVQLLRLHQTLTFRSGVFNISVTTPNFHDSLLTSDE